MIRVRLICRGGGGGNDMQMDWAVLVQKAAEGRLDRLDWQIIDALMYRGCTSYYSIEKLTGVYRQTIKRRMAKIRALFPGNQLGF